MMMMITRHKDMTQWSVLDNNMLRTFQPFIRFLCLIRVSRSEYANCGRVNIVLCQSFIVNCGYRYGYVYITTPGINKYTVIYMYRTFSHSSRDLLDDFLTEKCSPMARLSPATSLATHTRCQSLAQPHLPLPPNHLTAHVVSIRRRHGSNSHALKQWLQLRFDFDSTPIRLQFDRATTIRRPTLRPHAYLLCAYSCSAA